MVTIRPGTIADAVALSEVIFDRPYNGAEYERRLKHNTHLILIARREDRPVGFKVGYDRYHDGSFYSWLGGVIPEERNRGIGRKLMVEQEKWAKKQGFVRLKVKTRPKFAAMVHLLERSGFICRETIAKIPATESRLIFEKTIR